MMAITREQIEGIIKTQIKPLLVVDGGSIEVVDLLETGVRLRFGGKYVGSPCREIVFQYVVKPVLEAEFKDLEAIEWID